MSYTPENPQFNPEDKEESQGTAAPDDGYEIADSGGVVRHARIPLEGGGVIFYDNFQADEPWEV